MILDVFRRQIFDWAVHDRESYRIEAALVEAACRHEHVRRHQFVMPSDNGNLVKCATMLAELQQRGIASSLSRPGFSDDIPHIEALYRTLQHCADYPSKPVAAHAEAATCIQRLAVWHKAPHCQSTISFVAPNQRHAGLEVEILDARIQAYEAAHVKQPQRW